MHCFVIHSPKMYLNSNNIVERIKESISSVFLTFIINVGLFILKFQINFKFTASIEVSTLAPFSHI